MQNVQLEDTQVADFIAQKRILQNTLPKEIGKNYVEKIQLQEGFCLLKTFYELKTPIKVDTEQNKKKFVITVALEGNASYTNKDNTIINFKEGFTTISLLDNTQGYRQLHDTKIRQIRFILDENFLQKNLKSSLMQRYSFGENNLQLLGFAPTSLQTQRLLQEICFCEFPEELRALHVKAKALELLLSELDNLTQKKSSFFLDEYDKKALYRAKEILILNQNNPPSIAQLAKTVHLNECKLKKGFKTFFGISPYQFLLKYKLSEARTMLESGEYNINEVSFSLGYKYPNNFTNAFWKEFKILPKDVIKKHRYR